MGLGLETVRTTGRAAKPLPTVLSVRPLAADEVRARAAREEGVQASPLKRLSSRHRQLARQLAAGATPGEAALAVGLSASRVSILQSDPTFADLVAHYRLEIDAKLNPLFELMTGVAEDAFSIIRDRLEDDPESFENDELMRLGQLTADRTGHAPKRVEEKNINLNFGDRLHEARQRSLEAAKREATSAASETIEADYEVITYERPGSSDEASGKRNGGDAE